MADTRPDAAVTTGDAVQAAPLLCFDLYAASRAVTGVYRQVLEPLGLTYPQYLVLLLLWRRRSAGVREIVDELDLDYGTVSPLLKRLEARGLLARHRRADDERSVEITLTPAGEALQEQAAGVPAALERAFGLDADGLTRLHDVLAAVRTSADREAHRLGAGGATS
ncbi:MarR family winged helix-turn-helix transcriptional regulator [Kineococcus sp. NUM-3379]